MEHSEPIPLYFGRVGLVNVWEHPKLLDEGTRHRWRALEEEASKHAVERG